MFRDWHPIYIRDKETPVQIQRRLVAVGDMVYCTPGYTASITVFDAATGAVIKKYAGTEGTMEFVYDRGDLFVVTGDQSDVSHALVDPSRSALKTSLFRIGVYGPAIKQADNPKNDILAVDAESGKVLWRKSGADTSGYQGASVGVIGDRVVYSTAKELVCVDRATGETTWRVLAPIVLKGPSGIAASLVLSDRAVYLADSRKLRAFRLADGNALCALSAADGKIVWRFTADKLLYLRHQAFKPDLSPVKLQDVKQPHLIPSHGFLEAIPQHRSFWTIDTMLHYDIPTGLGGVHGDILVIDGPRFYEVRGYTPGRTAWFDPRTSGYTLYAGTYSMPAKAPAGLFHSPRIE